MSTPETTATPQDIKKDEVIPTPVQESTTEPTATPAQILDGVQALCNTTLYVLTKGFYPGADAHLVNQAKEFVKEIKRDVENKRKQLAEGKKVEGL